MAKILFSRSHVDQPDLFWVKGGGRSGPLVLTQDREKAQEVQGGPYPVNWHFKMEKRIESGEFELV